MRRLFKSYLGFGFSLLDLLACIAIIGLLSAIVINSAKGSGDAAKEASAKATARILSEAYQRYLSQGGAAVIPWFWGSQFVEVQDIKFDTTSGHAGPYGWSASELKAYLDSVYHYHDANVVDFLDLLANGLQGPGINIGPLLAQKPDTKDWGKQWPSASDPAADRFKIIIGLVPSKGRISAFKRVETPAMSWGSLGNDEWGSVGYTGVQFIEL